MLAVFCLAAKICRDKSECHPNAHCVFNAENSRYVCECLNGFDGDGVRECRRVGMQDTCSSSLLLEPLLELVTVVAQ